MTIHLGFRDHRGFQRAAVRMTACGAIAGLVGGIAGVGPIGALFAGAVGAIAGAGLADREGGMARMAARGVLALGALGAFVGVRALAGPPHGGHFGVLALAAVVGLALHLGAGPRRAVLGVVVGGAIAYLGAYAAGQVMIARETAGLPHVLEVALAATSMAIVSLAALLPRHLELAFVRDPIAAAQRALPAGLDADVRALLDRGLAVWHQASPRLDDDGRSLLRDAVLRLHDLAGRWSRVDAPAESNATLEGRRAELDRKIAASRDDVARTQYREARAAIDDQLGYVAAIEQSRERVLARLHACVATLEKFRLAAAHVESRSAAADARGATALLAEAAADIDACGAAIAEIDGHPATVPAGATATGMTATGATAAVEHATASA